MQMELRAQSHPGEPRPRHVLGNAEWQRQEEPDEHRNQDFPNRTRSLWYPHWGSERRDVTNPQALSLCLRNPPKDLSRQIWDH